MLNPEVRRGARTFGQLKSRVEELKNPWRQSSPLVLNYNESARLATDALVEQGEKGYFQALTEEKELPFLSSLDIDYICKNTNAISKSQDMLLDKDGDGVPDNCPSELTSGTYFPIMSDIDVPVLELGWPEIPLLTRNKGTEVQVVFQKHRNNAIKDLIRSLINKAKTVIAVVMDLFTDVDLLCDLIEAASKRRVAVYLLLDDKNLTYFIEMFQRLGFDKIHVPNMKIRTITGDTYCTKSGKKFSGQSLSKFLLIDCEHVVAGSYSFSWISSQVHNNMVTYFKGNIVEEFVREFRCLYACSLEAEYFSSLDNDNSNPFGHSPTRNRWAAIKTVPIPAPVIENSVHSDSNSSSGSQSSVKTPPFFKNQAITVIREEKPVLSKYINRNVNDTVEETSKKTVETSNDQRRQSDPHFDQNNLIAMQRRALSKSSPDLVDKTPSVLRTKFEQIQNKFLHPQNRTSPKNKSDVALNKVSNSNGSSSANRNVHLADIKREDASKRMTLGHSKLALITESNNKLLETKVYSRFQMRP